MTRGRMGALFVSLMVLAIALGLAMRAQQGNAGAPDVPTPTPKPPVDPPSVTVKMVPGQSIKIGKTVHVPDLPPKADIYFLADTTGSMGSILSQVQANFTQVINDIRAISPGAQFGAGTYKDLPGTSPPFTNGAAIGGAAAAAIAAWSASGGGDGPEGQFFALDQIADLADPTDISWQTNSSKILVWMGDAPGHDPICTAISGLTSAISESTVTAKLVARHIRVVAISTNTGFALGLNDTPTVGDYTPACGTTTTASAGQATRIAVATGGTYLTGISPANITAAIVAGISSVTFDISARPVECGGLNITFEPALYQNVAGPAQVRFSETITVKRDTGPGKISCAVQFLADGAMIAEQRVSVTVNVPTTITPGGPTDTPTPYVAHETPAIIAHQNCKPARLVGTKGWQTMTPPSDGVEGATGVIIGSKLYVTHGLSHNLNADSNITRIYNLLTDVWTIGVPAPSARSELVGVCALQGGEAKLFAIGGRFRPASGLGTVLNTVEMYNTVTHVWTTMAPMFTPRAGLGAVTDPRTNIIYAIGGRTGGDSPHEGTPLAVVEAYAPNANTWSTNTWSTSSNTFSATPLASMPNAMMDIYSTVYLDGKIYVIGGFDGANVSNLVQIYDIDTNMWSVGAQMPTARSNLIAGVCRGSIYAIGGSTNLLPTSPFPSTNLTTNEVYDPIMNSWNTALSKPTAASEMASSAISTGEEIFAIGSGLRGTHDAVNEVFTCTKAPTPTPTRTPAGGNTATRTPTATGTPAGGNTPTRTPTATPPAKPCGDVNDDGRVNSVDSNLILQYEAGLVDTLPNLPSGDVNGDGRVNSIDSNLILAFEAGLIHRLPCRT